MSVLGPLYPKGKLSIKPAVCTSALRMCTDVGRAERVEEPRLGGRLQMSVVLALGQYFVREFYVIGPLLIQHSCTEKLLSAGPYGEVSRSSDPQILHTCKLFQLRLAGNLERKYGCGGFLFKSMRWDMIILKLKEYCIWCLNNSIKRWPTIPWSSRSCSPLSRASSQVVLVVTYPSVHMVM